MTRLRHREWLAASTLCATGCAVRRTVAPTRVRPELARVNVAPARVIRTIVGLRPFRPAGFVVRGDKLNDKLVIHNYGHGGAGFTLSWGTAELAVTEAAQVEARRAAVIGCGVVGLSTARLLQQRGYAVTIYAKAIPPDTTSNIAGGLWSPVTVFDHDRVTPDFDRQFAEAGRFAFRRFQSLVGDAYGVRWLPTYYLSRDTPRTAAPPDSPNAPIDALYPDSRPLARGEHPFNVPYVYRRYSMLIEPAIYLNALMRDFLAARGELEVREFHETRQLAALREAVLFNCTGLGARDLFHDDELIPYAGS